LPPTTLPSFNSRQSGCVLMSPRPKTNPTTHIAPQRY
jgi:hypothetical protein